MDQTFANIQNVEQKRCRDRSAVVQQFFRSNSAQYFQNRQTMHNPLDLPNIYPTAPKLSNKNGVSVVWIYNTLKLAQPNNWFFPAPCPHPRYNLKSHCYNFSVGVFGSFCPVWVIECGRVVLVVLGRVVGSKRGWVGADGFKPESAILRVLDSFGTLRGGRVVR